MQMSLRVRQLQESITLKLNEQVGELTKQGKSIFNLTAGQLPFHPPAQFVHHLSEELKFLKSFQYSPVPGFPELRNLFLTHIENSRHIHFSTADGGFDTVIGNGAKQIIFNALGALINEGDEALLLSPYWISYPEMVRFWGGKVIEVKGDHHHHFVPSLEKVAESLTPHTKVMIVNSPNNPVGLHYPDEWMKGLSAILEKFPDLTVISDEIYFDLCYYDPKPTYFYHYNPELLKRTLIIDGISKSLASTGLRIGYGVGPKKLVKAISKVQGQTTSGANSLAQRALIQYEEHKDKEFMEQVREHLRSNAKIIKDCFLNTPLEKLLYPCASAFYFLIDFSKTPLFSRYTSMENPQDYSATICEDLLNQYGVAMVPGGDFGAPNCGRLSLVLNHNDFQEAMERIKRFLMNS